MATDKSDISIYSYPKVMELNYNTSPQKIHTVCISDAGTPQYITTDTSYQSNIIEKTDAGSYPVVFYVQGDDEHNSTIAYDVSTAVINKAYPFNSIPILKSPIRFTGQSYNPILKNGSIKWGGSLKNYIFDERNSELVSKISEPGTYYVCTRLLDSEKHEISYKNLIWPSEDVYDSAFVADGSTFVKWNKFRLYPATTAWTSAPKEVTAEYTGSSINLCTPGKLCLENCTVLYNVDCGDFSRHVPTATEVGTYEVGYRVYYYNKDNDASGYLDTRYAPDASGSITSVIKLNKFFTDDFDVVNDFVYDGTMHELTTGRPNRNTDIAYYGFTDNVWDSGDANVKPVAKDPGTYDVWYWCETENGTIVTTELARDGMPDEHTPVKKGSVTITKGYFFTDDFGLTGDFEYDGEEHVLVKGGALRSTDYILYSTDNKTYGEANVKPVAKNAGVYDIYVRPYDNCNDLVDYRKTYDGVLQFQNCIYLGRVTVSKVKSFLDNEAFKLICHTHILYDGNEHDFVNGLEKPSVLNKLLLSEFGTFEKNVYFSSNLISWTNLDDMNWGTGLGMLWATNKRKYTTYYKVVPNDLVNYDESEIYSFTVIIY